MHCTIISIVGQRGNSSTTLPIQGNSSLLQSILRHHLTQRWSTGQLYRWQSLLSQWTSLRWRFWRLLALLFSCHPSHATLLMWKGLFLLWQSQLFKELAQKTETGWFCIIWIHMIFAQNPTTGGSFRLSSPGRFVASSTPKGMICQWSRVGFWINYALMSTNKVMWSYCLMQSVFSPPMDLMEGISTDPARPWTAISQN